MKCINASCDRTALCDIKHRLIIGLATRLGVTMVLDKAIGYTTKSNIIANSILGHMATRHGYCFTTAHTQNVKIPNHFLT